MNPTQLTVAPSWQSERRLHDRRHIPVAEIVYPHLSVKRYAVLSILLLVSSLLVWQWRYVVYAPLWLVRAHWADRSDLYQGSTNSVPNRNLVLQARTYLKDIDRVDRAGNLMAPETLRPLGIRLDPDWFRQHHPAQVDFNPFLSPGGSFVVSWVYRPGCQKTIWKSPRIDTDWYDLRGQPCFGLCRLSVLMAPDLRLTSIRLDTIQTL